MGRFPDPPMHHSLLRSFRLASALAAVAIATSVARSADHVMMADYVANPAPHIETNALKTFRASKTIIVPTIHLRVMTHGSVFVAKGIGGSTASAKGTFSVHGIEKPALQALSAQLQDSLVKNLRAGGWTVLTYEDIKNDPEVTQLERRKGEEPWGFAQEKDGGGRLHYAVVTPSDEQCFKPAMQGLNWSFRHVAKARNATVIIPQIDIYVPQVWAESRKGYSSASASVKSLPGMNLNHVMITGINGGGGGGVLFKAKYAVVNLGENVGAFADAKDKTPSAANGISKGLGILSGAGSISRSSAEFKFVVDPKPFEAGVLRGGDAFFGYVAKAIASEKQP